MQAKHTFVLKYVLGQQHSTFGFVPNLTEVPFFECEGEVDPVAVEAAAKKAWSEILTEVGKNSAFEARDPELICTTTYIGVVWQ